MAKISQYDNGTPFQVDDQIPLTRNVDGTLTTLRGLVGSSSLDAWLPSQTGNSGKVLTTNGTTAAWQTNAGGDVTGPSSATDLAVAIYDGTTGKLIKNSLATISSTGSISAASLFATTSGSGNSPSVEYNFNKFFITADTIDGTTGGGTKVNGVEVSHVFGGAAAAGGRHALYAVLTQNNITSGSNTDRNYVAFAFQTITNSGDGGGSGTELGAYFGVNGYVRATSGATHILNLSGGEFNTNVQTGASVKYKSGIQIHGIDQVQGSTYDTMIGLSNLNSGTAKWKHGILIGPMAGTAPIDATVGTLFGTAGSATVDYGIDISSYTCTTAEFKSTNTEIKSTQFNLTGTNHGIDIGKPGTANTPFIDFHSSANNIDYNFRMIASGGDGTVGTGAMTFQGAALSFKNGFRLRTNTTAADTFILSAYDVNGAAYTDFITLTANNDPSCAINGATITNSAISGAAGSFTTLAASSTVTFNMANANASLAPTGTGTVTINPATAGTMNNMVIGGSTPLAGTFTTATANSFTPNLSTIPACGMYLPATNQIGFSSESRLNLVVQQDPDPAFPGTSGTVYPYVKIGGHRVETSATDGSVIIMAYSADIASVSMRLTGQGPVGGIHSIVDDYINMNVGSGGQASDHCTYVNVVGGPVATSPAISAQKTYPGDSDAFGLNFYTQGNGPMIFFSDNTSTTLHYMKRTASGVTYTYTAPGATGNAATWGVEGETNTSAIYTTKGTGTHFFKTNDSAQEQFLVTHTASAVNVLSVTGGATGTDPSLSVGGTSADATRGMSLRTKGTGAAGISMYCGGALQAQVYGDSTSTSYFVLTGGNNGVGCSAQGGTNPTMTFYTTGTGSISFLTNNLGTAILELTNAGLAKFTNSAANVANGTATITVSNLGPAGISTATIKRWLLIKGNDDADLYIPCWGS